jgi:hypothetical protein
MGGLTPSTEGAGLMIRWFRRKPAVKCTASVVLAGLVLVGCGTTPAGPAAKISATTSPPAAATSTAPPSVVVTESVAPSPAAPDPHAELDGSCDYELSTNINDYERHAGDLAAEVSVTNTGNIGVVITVTISWPQYGRKPILGSRSVRVAVEQTVTVQFTRVATSPEISRLQSAMEHDDYELNCDYDGRITDMFGGVR